MELKDKIVIVTGGAMGIGKACAEAFIKDGAYIIIADFNEVEGSKAAEELCCDFFHTDISKEEDVSALRDYVTDKYDHLDVLINNAAVHTDKKLSDFTVKDFQNDINVNLIGTFACIKILCGIMRSGSTILNMLSVHYEQPRLNRFAYDASKAGVAMLTSETAIALADIPITVNGISYGAVRTPMQTSWKEHPELAETTKEKIPLRWIAEPEEIAHYAKIIVTEFSEHATGSIFTFDGGRRLK